MNEPWLTAFIQLPSDSLLYISQTYVPNISWLGLFVFSYAYALCVMYAPEVFFSIFKY